MHDIGWVDKEAQANSQVPEPAGPPAKDKHSKGEDRTDANANKPLRSQKGSKRGKGGGGCGNSQKAHHNNPNNPLQPPPKVVPFDYTSAMQAQNSGQQGGRHNLQDVYNPFNNHDTAKQPRLAAGGNKTFQARSTVGSFGLAGGRGGRGGRGRGRGR